MHIGIIVIATNKYIQFFDKLYTSLVKHFVADRPDIHLTVFLFTDGKHTSTIDPRINIITIHQAHEPWPNPTLFLYSWMVSNRHTIEKEDVTHLFYVDVDSLIANPVSVRDLGIGSGKPLLAVHHPGFYQQRSIGTPETRPSSRCYVDLDKHPDFVYVAGGFQGGVATMYLNAAVNMANAIQTDVAHGLIPLWHDESAWNAFVAKNRKLVHLATPELCYPESWSDRMDKTLVPRIIALDKNHAEVRL